MVLYTRAALAVSKGAIIALAVALLASTFVARAPRAEAGAKDYSWKHAERCFMKKVNRRRAKAGLTKLSWDKQLGYVARRHANRMSRAGTIWHDGDIGTTVTNWETIGQNTGKGKSCKQLSRAFWNSGPHRDNVLGKWKFIGVGTRWRGNRLYVQAIFESVRNPGNVYSYP